MTGISIPRVRAKMAFTPSGVTKIPIVEGYYVKHALNSGYTWGPQPEIEYKHYIVVDEPTDWGLEPNLKLYEINVDTLEIIEE